MVWIAGVTLISDLPTAVGTALLGVLAHLFTRRRQAAASVAGWVYEFPMADDYNVNGRRLASSGDPGYIGKSKHPHPAKRWAQANHPIQQGWGKRWLDARSVTVWPCGSLEEMDDLEGKLIEVRLRQGFLLFNERGVPAERRLPRWEDVGGHRRDAAVDEGPEEMPGVRFVEAPDGVPGDAGSGRRVGFDVRDVSVEHPRPVGGR